MKNLNITFTDAQFRKLKKAKDASPYKNWELFVLYMCSKGVSTRSNNYKGRESENGN
jgi:hypothetical protein